MVAWEPCSSTGTETMTLTGTTFCLFSGPSAREKKIDFVYSLTLVGYVVKMVWIVAYGSEVMVASI